MLYPSNIMKHNYRNSRVDFIQKLSTFVMDGRVFKAIVGTFIVVQFHGYFMFWYGGFHSILPKGAWLN